MGRTHHTVAKHRLQWSTLLLVLLGLCSVASPHDLNQASHHHRSPSSTSRASRHLSRNRTSSSSRTSAEAEVEPEVPVGQPAHFIAGGEGTQSNATQRDAQALPVLASFAPAKIVRPVPLAQNDPSIVSTLSFRPHLGRAPPSA